MKESILQSTEEKHSFNTKEKGEDNKRKEDNISVRRHEMEE